MMMELEIKLLLAEEIHRYISVIVLLCSK